MAAGRVHADTVQTFASLHGGSLAAVGAVAYADFSRMHGPIRPPYRVSGRAIPTGERGPGWLLP
jgi:hypothetical protein